MARRLQASAGGRGRHSPVYQWLLKRAETFQRLLDETQPSWKSVAAALSDLDVRDGSGKPPTPECVRQAWNAVKKAKARQFRRPSEPLPAFVVPLPPPVSISVMPSHQAPSDDGDDDEFVFKTLTRRQQ